MILSSQDMDLLRPYEKQLNTALHYDYARGLSRIAYQHLHSVYMKINPRGERLNSNCAFCVLRILKVVAMSYFATLNEMKKVTKKASKKVKEAE